MRFSILEVLEIVEIVEIEIELFEKEMIIFWNWDCSD